MTLSATSPAPIPVSEEAVYVARLLTFQGTVQEADYLALETNWLVEFTDGYLEVLPMPGTSHQLIVDYLLDAFKAFILPANRGRVLFAPLRVRVRPSMYREPDLVFMLAAHASRMGEKFWDGADLVVEVVSDDWQSHERDFERKRIDYADGGIPEYWIVDPRAQRITVLKLQGTAYALHGEFGPGTLATSLVLEGFTVAVAAVFAAANS